MKKITKLFVMAALLMVGSQIYAQEEHEYVDLGLPSGTLWATCNVGATTPEGYGDYFAWGETAQKDKDTYNRKNYQLSPNSRLTKYCNRRSSGDIDNLAILQSMDDAAMVNWGEDWRMPTKAQWEELLQNTTQEWTTQGNVKGCLFTASNGSSMFLPASGRIMEGGRNDEQGRGACYWTSSLNTEADWEAWYGCIAEYNKMVDCCSRCCGCVIRPVRLEPKK